MTSLRTFIFLATLAILLWLFYWAKAVLLPIAVAILLAFILKPLVVSLQRIGLRHVIAVMAVTFLAFLVLGGIGVALSLEVKEFAEQLPKYQNNIAKKLAVLREAGKGSFLDRMEKTFEHIDGGLLAGGKLSANSSGPIPVRVESSSLWEWSKMLGPAADSLATAGLIVALVIFMLIYNEDLRGRVILLVGHGQLTTTTRAMDEAARRVGRYLLMQTFVNAFVGVTISAGLALIGIPYALLWGFLAAMLRFIPYLGIWVVAILLTAFAVAVSPGWTQPLVMLGLFVALETATSQVIEPLVFGHSTGIIPTALLIAAAFWTWLWGPWGLLLSTPLTTCLVVLGKYVPGLEFLDILLADGGAIGADIRYYQRLLARDQDGAVSLIEEYVHHHSPETVYDEVLVPALARTQADWAVGRLSQEDQQFAIHVTREIVDDTLAAQIAAAGHPTAHEEPSQPQSQPQSPSHGEPKPPPLVLFGFPARDEADELALHMFHQLLMALNVPLDMEILSTKVLVAEAVSQIRDHRSAIVCVAAIPPGGVAQARYLCKRLRSAGAEHRIIVGRWGVSSEHLDEIRDRLRDLHVDHVATTLIESRNQILPWLRSPPRPTPPPTPTPGFVGAHP